MTHTVPIQIISDTSLDELVDEQLLIDTLERNRERIRTIANMSLTVAGVMVSAGVAFILYTVEHRLGGKLLPALFCLATLLFLVSVTLTLLASTLRNTYVISTRSRFVADLLVLYRSELRVLRWSFVPLIGGFVTIVVSAAAFIAGMM